MAHPLGRARGLARRLSLRTRLTLISALVVAIAVAAVAGAAYVVVSRQLRSQTDSALSSQLQLIELSHGRFISPPTANSDTRVVAEFSFHFVAADGSQTSSDGSSPLTAPLDFVALADNLSNKQVRETTSLQNGAKVRVLAASVSVNATPFDQGTPQALVIARSLSDDDSTLGHLRIFLLIAGGLGVLVAAAGGLVVARSGLRPVDRLTEAAEHIARTEELDVPIEVSGSDELARLALAFNAMTAALASSRVRQQQLVADAGHELRTPLTSLRTNLDLLIRSERSGRVLPAEDKERLLEDLRAQMSELGTLVGELVNLARDDRAIEPSVPVDLALVVARAAERARLRGGLVDVRSEPWFLVGRPGELERAVVNLLDNAVKFSPAGVPVEVVLHDGVLTVADRGPGIAADDLPHVFERFYRSTSARGMPGSGLGLAIVAQTVEAHGGTVALAARADGAGTIATVTVPGETESTIDTDAVTDSSGVAGHEAVDGFEHSTSAASWQRPQT